MIDKRLSQLRKEVGLTQEELAKKLRLTRSALSLYELGKRDPDTETLSQFADFFDVSVDYLMGRTDKRDFTEAVTKTSFILDVSGLPEEAIKQVEEFIGLIRLKYTSGGSLK